MKLSIKKLILMNRKKIKYNSYNNDIPLNLIKQKLEISNTKKRINIIILILFIYFLSLSMILILKSNNFKQNKNTWSNSKFSRPDILDRNGEIIATNLPTSILCMHPKKFLNPEKSIKQLIKIIPSLNYDDIINKLNSKKELIYIERNITPKIQNQILKIGEPGFSFETTNTRFYPQKNLFSHITGNTDIDNKGISGILILTNILINK